MTLDELGPGLELGPSCWLEVPQARIDAFADATEDHQSFHVDAEAAARGPYGTTVAHGYLTLSLLPALVFELLPVEATVINYGVDRVRFPAPVPSGSRIRASVRVDRVEPVGGGVQVAMTATAERDGGGDRPVCVAELLFRYLA
jgi:acyl dehydratase